MTTTDDATDDVHDKHGTERPVRPIYIYWHECMSCDYETAAHGRVSCWECGDVMKPVELAGAVVDDRSLHTGTERDDSTDTGDN